MVHKSFVGGFGPAYGNDDRTDFLYKTSDLDALKELVDGIDVTICRDGGAGDDGLDVLIQKMESEPGIALAAEMIPVEGKILRVETPWSGDSEHSYKTFSHDGGFQIGVKQGDEIYTLDIWYSREAYLAQKPENSLETTDTTRIETPQEPITFKLS